MRTASLYKIMSASLWKRAEDEGRVPWAAVDLTDGFVHLSSASQARETAARHFAGQGDLLLVSIDPDLIPEGTLRWEASRGGALFPHVHGDIPLTAVMAVEPLPLVDGGFVFPKAVP